jgi:GAF domain-containing protein
MRPAGTQDMLMTQNNDPAMMPAMMEEEIVLPEHLLPLGGVLGQGVSAMDLCMVLAKIFHVQYTEVALLRLESGMLRFLFPEHLRTTGSIPLSSKAVAAHTALSKKAEIFNNFARVKHASIFETIKPEDGNSEDVAPPAPIQKLMSVPVMDRGSNVVGVIQISRKGLDAKYAQDFSREDLHDLEIAAGLIATAPALLAN